MAAHQHFLRDSDGTLTAVRSPIVWSPADEIDEADPEAIAAEVANHREAAGQPRHDAETLPTVTMAKAMGIMAHINLQQAERAAAAGNEFMAIYHRQAAADYAATADRLRPAPATANVLAAV